MRISNVNTISALFDRLITENIKLYFFYKDGKQDLIDHQETIITAIKDEIEELILQTMHLKRYDFIGEKRTFVREMLVVLEELVYNDIHIGESDRARLNEVKSETPSIDVMITNEMRLRTANEGRAMNKNDIDNIFKEIVTD